MRIAVVHSFYSSKSPSGENTVVDEQVRTLRAAGHDVHLVARHTDEEEQQSGYNVLSAVTAATGWGRSPHDELDALRPDVVHVHNTFPNLGTRWLRRWADRTVVTLHNYRTVCAAATLFRDGAECTDCLSTPVLPGVRHACYRGSRAASLPVALAAAPGGGLRDLLHLPAEIVTLNGEMAGRFASLTDTPVTVIPNFVPPGQAPTVAGDAWAYVGRLSAEKGIGELLEAWPDDQRLVVYGDGELGPELRNKHGSRDNIEFRGIVGREDVLHEIGAYRGLMVPSMCAEGLPTAILEALAAGVPSVVSTYVSAGAELEAAGVSQRVTATPTGLGDLSPALAAVLNAGPVMRERALHVHRDRFSPESWLRDMTAVYERVAG